MLKFRELYKFQIPRLVETFEEVEDTNSENQPVIVKKKVQKEAFEDFCLRKPTRSLYDEADLYYNKTVSKGLDEGLASYPLLVKKFENSGGIMSEPEKKEWAKKVTARYEKENEFKHLSVTPSRSEEQEKQLKELIQEIALLDKDLRNYEIREQSLYDITAEARARKLTVGWWLLFLLYKKDKEKWVPFFEGEKNTDKEEAYDERQDEDLPKEELEFNKKVIDHAYKATALWYYSRASNQEEFTSAIESLNKNDTPVEPEVATTETN